MLWKKEYDSKHILVHKDISDKVARKLNVKSVSKPLPTVTNLLQLRQAEMGESLEYMEDFEQSEKLTDRLRNLLRDYDERSVLYEFIQNADDAGYVKEMLGINVWPR
jgi:hypothetical protein